MFHVLDELVERRIAQAQAEGAFDDLPGAGAPLALDDDPLVPQEWRVAYRILRNAGLVPPEIAHLREIRRLLACAADDASDASDAAVSGEGGARAARRRLLALRLALEARGIHLGAETGVRYRVGLIEKLSGAR